VAISFSFFSAEGLVERVWGAPLEMADCYETSKNSEQENFVQIVDENAHMPQDSLSESGRWDAVLGIDKGSN